MKIFNWVHRKFHFKDEFDKNAKKIELIDKDTDTKALLENEDIADIIDGLKGKLLSIGTLGLDPLQKHIDDFEHYQISEKNGEESEYDGDDDEEEHSLSNDEFCFNNEMQDGELDPLVCSTFSTNLEGSNTNGMKIELHDDAKDLNFDQPDEKSKKKERITLADLFYAEKYENTKPNLANKVEMEWTETASKTKLPTTQAKHVSLSFAKKLRPRIYDDSRPIQKLQQLMTRMLKRKIHPDLEGKYQKTSQNKPGVVGLFSNKHGDSVSLLQTQDVEL